MRSSFGWLLKLLPLWLWAGFALAQDDPPGRVGRLAALQGEVWLQEPGSSEWTAALQNRPFTAGERLSTGPGGSAELRIGSTTVFLGSQTEFEALRLDDERLQFRLQRGQMALRVPSPEVATELEVLHPEARVRPLRAGFYRLDRLAEATDVTVWRGELQVEGHNLSLTLHAGQRAAFWREGTLGDTTRQWLTQQQDDFALAVQRQDQALAQLAPSDLVPAEMTGVEDLQRYGSWNSHPEYGAVWVPSVVAAGWAPYRQGQWVWQPPWGWTWVDAAPWGFAPFHYGRWLWWSNRWCWTPGPRVKRPVYAPALVGWVGAAPAPGGHWRGRPPPAQGWVPLGPREPFRPDYRASPRHVQRLNPHPSGQPPGLVNRHVPGAVTMWPAPRPVDEARRQGQDPRGRRDGPDRAEREQVAPRAVAPQAVPATAPSPPQQAGFAAQQADEMARRRLWQEQRRRDDAPGRAEREHAPPRAAVPPAAPSPAQPQAGFAAQQADEMAARRLWQEQRSRQDAPGRAAREPMAPRATAPVQAAAPAAAAPAVPAAATGPFGGRPIRQEAAQRQDDRARPDPGERRRAPEMRGNQRER